MAFNNRVIKGDNNISKLARMNELSLDEAECRQLMTQFKNSDAIDALRRLKDLFRYHKNRLKY